jgi:hypothetical protein
MNKVLLFFIMVWLHIVDDYYLQSILAQMKQKKWWINNEEYKPLYKYDYIVALIAHGFSWSFTVHIPFIVLYFMNSNINQYTLIFSIIIHTFIHTYVDNMKANKRCINLIVDQLIHMIQLIIILIIMMI